MFSVYVRACARDENIDRRARLPPSRSNQADVYYSFKYCDRNDNDGHTYTQHMMN